MCLRSVTAAAVAHVQQLTAASCRRGGSIVACEARQPTYIYYILYKRSEQTNIIIEAQ